MSINISHRLLDLWYLTEVEINIIHITSIASKTMILVGKSLLLFEINMCVNISSYNSDDWIGQFTG